MEARFGQFIGECDFELKVYSLEVRSRGFRRETSMFPCFALFVDKSINGK